MQRCLIDSSAAVKFLDFFSNQCFLMAAAACSSAPLCCRLPVKTEIKPPLLCRKAEKCSCFHRMQNGSGFTNCTDCIHQRTMCLKYAALFKHIAGAVALLMLTRLVSSKIFFYFKFSGVECVESKRDIISRISRFARDKKVLKCISSWFRPASAGGFISVKRLLT